MKKNAIIIFAKEPRLNRVKTRLAVDLGNKLTLELYKCFVQDVLNTVNDLECEKYIFYSGVGWKLPFLSKFKKKFTLKRQMGSDLGARMLHAFQFGIKQGHNNVVIIGTDCLTIKKSDIKQSFKSLENHDYVIGPSCDGGYYLIGTKKPQKQIFSRVHWSTDHVCEKTIGNISALKKSYVLLSKKEDVDDLKSLKRLKSKKSLKQLSPVTCHFLVKKLKNI